MSFPNTRPKSPPNSCSKLSRGSAYLSNHSMTISTPYNKLTSGMNIKQNNLPVFLRPRRSSCETHYQQFNNLRMLDQSFQYAKPDSVFVNHKKLTAKDIQSLTEAGGPFSSNLVDICISLIKQKANNNNEKVFIASTSYGTNIFINKRLISHCKVSVLQYE